MNEAKERPNGITMIAVLWVLTSIFVINWGLTTILVELETISYFPELYDPDSYYWEGLSMRSRQWISFGFPAEMVLLFSLVVLSCLTVFTAIGLYTAKTWSYKSAFVISPSTVIISGALAALHISAPTEIYLAADFHLYYALALLNVGWITVIIVYLTKPSVKQFIIGSPKAPPSPISPLYAGTRKGEIISWINQWKDPRKLDFSLEHEQFFLEGRHLDDFSKELISHAKSEVLIVNPFIQNCDLSNTLVDAKERGINVRVITRLPDDKIQKYLEEKQEYLTKLEQKGISLVYEKNVHAKLIMVDRTVAIVSSMNFYADSSAGVTWEAGLVSLDKKVIDSIVNSLSSKFI